MGRSSKLLLKTVNLEAGMPTVPAALSRLHDLLRGAHNEGYLAVKIIHGYGSSGLGGQLRQSVQAELQRRLSAGEIRAWIAGEDWRISNQEAWELLNAIPELRKDFDLGRENRGISVVVF